MKRGLVVVLTVVALLWAAGGMAAAVVGVHEDLHHGHGDRGHGHTGALKVAIHGHAHQSEPDHDHDLATTVPAARTEASVPAPVVLAEGVVDPSTGLPGRAELDTLAGEARDDSPPVYLLNCVQLS